MNPSVWLVVLNWNGRTNTLELLAGLTREPATVLVVDNASTDGTLTAVRERHPNVRTLQTGANLGFAGGNNAGIAHALAEGADIVGVLNNDTLVEPGFLGPLVDALVGPALRAVSPDIRYATEPELSWFRGGVIDTRAGRPHHLAAAEQPDPAGDPVASEILSGCCLLASARTWRRVGLFDEGMFLIFEDSDWSIRAREAGVELAVVRASRIRHKVSGSFRGGAGLLGEYYLARNGLVFAARYLGPRCVAQFAAREVLRPAIGVVRGPDRRVRALLRGAGAAAAVLGKRGPAGRVARRVARSGRQRRGGLTG